jgi:14-3-3 protein epsilon
MATREEITFFARLSEQAERFEDMMKYTKMLVDQSRNTSSELNLEERNLLSVAYKNAVSAKRMAVRQIEQCLQAEAGFAGNPAVMQYKKTVEDELTSNCAEILRMLQEFLILTATTAEAKTFYLKMEGDYHRYLAEFSSDRQSAATNAYNAYSRAQIEAAALNPTHPIRLGLALNFSVFFFEVQKQNEEAINLAQSSLEAANAALGSCPPEEKRDSEQILQLLMDNLQLWKGCGSQVDMQDGTQVQDL